MRVLALISFIIYSNFLTGQEKVDYTLNECIEYALQNSELVKVSELGKLNSEAVIGETRGLGLPQVNLNSGLNHNYEIQKSIIDFSEFDPRLPEGSEQEIAFGQAYDGNLTFAVDQLIFDGSYIVALQAAKTYRELSSKEHIKTEIDVVESVSKAYYTALINEERLVLISRNFSRLDTLLRETTAMYENGFAEKIDVDRIRVNLNNTKVEFERLKKLTEVSYQLLKFQMGLPLGTTMNLTENLDEADLNAPELPSDFTYGDRVEYSTIMTNQELATLDMKNNKVQRLPKLYGSFSYGYNTAAGQTSQWFKSDRWLNYGTVGVTLSYSIFDGAQRAYKIQQSQLQIRQLELQKQSLQKSIDLEITQANINLNSNLESLEVQKENMELAQNIFDITKIKFQEGIGSNLEVIEADASLKEAQTNYYAALYDAVISKIELLKALGRLHKS